MKNKTILLQSNTQINYKEKVNLVLSPEFYWIRVFDIPVKSEKEALKLLPSLFEESIQVDHLSYYVKKTDEKKFLCLAYDQLKIIEQIKKSGLVMHQIVDIYFAQFEFASFVKNDQLFNVDSALFRYMDGILVQYPLQLSRVNDIPTSDLNAITLSKNKIYINSSSRYLNLNTSIHLSILIMIVTILVFIKTVSQDQKIKDFQLQKENLKQQYNLPATFIQLDSILATMGKKTQSQMKMRSLLSYIFAYKKGLDFQLVEFGLHQSNLNIVFQDNSSEKFVQYLKASKHKIVSVKSLDSKQYEVRIAL